MVADLFGAERPRRKRGRPRAPEDQNLNELRYRVAVWAREAGHAPADAPDLDAFLAARDHFLSPEGQAEISGSELPEAKRRWLSGTVFNRNIDDTSVKRSIERGKASIVGG
jgi:hypothetical protein